MRTALVDYHCHLDLYSDFENLIAECEKEQIYTLAVTTTPQAWPRNQSLTKDLKYVRAALGLHPQLIAQRKDELSIWLEYFSQTKFVGEVGLDAGPQFYKSFQEQIKVFEEIIKQCSKSSGKILSVHSVRATTHVLEVFKKFNLLEHNKVVLHWFSGTLTEAKRAASMGCYFSVNTPMLSTLKGQELLKTIPKYQILTETDGPFTMVNGRRQKPKDIIFCIRSISEYWQHSQEETINLIVGNLINLETF